MKHLNFQLYPFEFWKSCYSIKIFFLQLFWRFLFAMCSQATGLLFFHFICSYVLDHPSSDGFNFLLPLNEPSEHRRNFIPLILKQLLPSTDKPRHCFCMLNPKNAMFQLFISLHTYPRALAQMLPYSLCHRHQTFPVTSFSSCRPDEVNAPSGYIDTTSMVY